MDARFTASPGLLGDDNDEECVSDHDEHEQHQHERSLSKHSIIALFWRYTNGALFIDDHTQQTFIWLIPPQGVPPPLVYCWRMTRISMVCTDSEIERPTR